jgi:uncharacterized protein
MDIPPNDAGVGGMPQNESPEGRFGRKTLAWLRRGFVLLLVLYLAVVGAAMVFENKLLYFPVVYPTGNWRPNNLAFEDAWFQSADGTSLHGWYVPCPGAKAAVLYCHGNGGNVTHRTEKLRTLRDQVGVATLIFDYRGYGRSQGQPSEAGVMADARAARRWLADREKIAERDVVVLGESLGGAVAVDLAARDGARALVLESVFNNLPDVGAYHYPYLPVRWLMRSRFDSDRKIAAYHGPVWQTHGDADQIIPLPLAQRLFAAANEPKRFVLLPGHDHNDPLPADCCVDLKSFLGGLPPIAQAAK